MSMTRKQIVDAVLRNGFKEAQRDDAQAWVDYRLSWIWVLEDWTFKYATATVTVTAATNTATLPTDFGQALALIRPSTGRLTYLPPAVFFDTYYDGATHTTGTPEAYTIVGTTLYIGPYSDETDSTYLLPYIKDVTLLTSDTSVPDIPGGFHMALVHGGKAEGFRLTNIDAATAFEQDFQAAITAMKRAYLVTQSGEPQQMPADDLADY